MYLQVTLKAQKVSKWLLDDEKMVISRNVVFREDKVYKEVKDQPKGQENEDSGSQIVRLESGEESDEAERNLILRESSEGQSSTNTVSKY